MNLLFFYSHSISNQIMRIKFMNLQLIRIPCLHPRPHPPAIKLIKSDGLVKIYDRPIHVSQLLDEHPCHLVCRSDAFFIGQKIPALSRSDKLQLGHKYFLLPQHCFQSVLSFVTIASFVSTSPSSALLKKAARCRAFDIQKSPSGCLRIRVSDEFISQLMQESKMVGAGRVCSTPELEKDYGMLVRSRQWKPKLDTIREKSWSFGMKKKSKDHQSKFKSKIKMKIKLRK